jgi:hypothetical protein
MIDRIMSKAKILNFIFARLEKPKHEELGRVNEGMGS